MTTIKNLTNSPHDLVSLKGPLVLPAMGEVTDEFALEYLVALEGIGYFELSADPARHPLDHDGDGRLGGVKNPEPLSDDEEADLIGAMTDEELREFIKGRTGKAPHHKAKTETLLAQAKAAIEGVK